MKTKKILSILILIVIVLLAVAVFKKFYDPKGDDKANQLSDKQITSLVKKVSKLIDVPEEKPIVATIIKAEELIAEQKFYVGSKDGDYLIVFPTAKKALIYREKENRLINVGPIIVDQQATSTQQTESIEKEQVSTSTKKEDNKKTE